MSIQNILTPNNLSLFCENLNLSGQIVTPLGNVPSLDIITHAVPLYYNSTFVTNLNCNFVRITSGNIPGIVIMIIPSYTVTQSVASTYYLNLSGFGDILMYSSIVTPYLVTNDSVVSVGSAFCQSGPQIITFYGGPQTGTNFAIGTSGLAYQSIITYQQAYA